MELRFPSGYHHEQGSFGVIPSLYPLFVIGVKAFASAKERNFHLVMISNENVREILGSLTFSHPRDIFLSDFASLTGTSSSVLLKFVEEYKGNVIVHSSEDNVNEVLLSRFRYVIKDDVAPSIETDSDEALLQRKPELLSVVYSRLPHNIKRRILETWL